MAEHSDRLIARMEEFEHDAKLEMVRKFRAASPVLYKATKARRGLGEHMVARLLGIIGDPRIAHPHAWLSDSPPGHECGPRCTKGKGKTERHLVAFEPRERTLAQLWSYCRLGDPTRKAHKGMSQEDAMALGVARARALLYVASECAIRERQPDQPYYYRPVYDAAKAQYAERDWTDGHRHNAALRRVAKEILRDLWVAAGAG